MSSCCTIPMSVDENPRVSLAISGANYNEPYTLPTMEENVKGGAKLGAGLVVDGNERLSVNADGSTITIDENGVVSSVVADGSITTDKLDDGIITTPKLADGAVTASKLDSTVLGMFDGNVKGFDTVADMQAATLEAGEICHTNGFHTAGDGGAAFYKVTASGTANGMDVLACGDLFANLVITESYVTPEMFGAWGDGVHDDTAVLNYLLTNDYSIQLVNKYLISDSLLSNTTKSISIKGNCKWVSWYGTGSGGSIIVSDGVSTFKNCTISGVFDNIAFIGQGANGQTSNTTQYLFDGCTLNKFNMENCYCLNFEAIFYNTSINRVSLIDGNTFLSCYYFAKVDTSTYLHCADSSIINNYINGGTKYNNNKCFQWASFIQSTLQNNFIDFYQTIFDPSSDGLRSNVSFNVRSVNDRYEVFKYFISHIGLSYVNGSFIAPQICHIDLNDPTVSAVLNGYESQQVTSGGVTYNLDAYLIYVPSSRPKEYQVSFENVKLYTYTDTLKPINLTGQKALFTAVIGAYIKMTFENRDKVTQLYNDQIGPYTYYGTNPELVTTNLIRTLDSAPSIPSGYNQTTFEVGVYYVYANVLYKCIRYYNGSAWKLGLQNTQTGSIDYTN